MKGFMLIEMVLLLLILAIIFAAPYWAKKDCETKANRMQMNYDWRLIGGCFVEPKPGIWVPLNNYRVFD